MTNKSLDTIYKVVLSVDIAKELSELFSIPSGLFFSTGKRIILPEETKSDLWKENSRSHHTVRNPPFR